MAIYSLADLRASAPEELRNASDEVLLNEYSKATGLNPLEVADYLGYGKSGGTFSNRVMGALANYTAGMRGLGEAITGSEGLRRRREGDELEAAIAANRVRELGGVNRWADVNSLGDFGSYAADLAIQSLPYLGEAAVGGIVGRGLATGARQALRTAGEAGDLAAMARAQRTLTGASLAGAGVASYPSAVGDILQSQRDQSPTGETDLGMAALGGVPYAAANMVGLEGAAARLGGFRSIGRTLDDMGGVRGAAARTAATGARVGATEGAAETFQEGINQYFGRMAVDPTETFYNPESAERFKESFIGGATLGGLGGAGLGGWRRSESWQQEQLRQQLEAQQRAELARRQAEQQAAQPQDLLAQDFGSTLETNTGIIQPINPYDIGGYVTQLRQGGETDVTQPQFGLFGGGGETTFGSATAPAPTSEQKQAAVAQEREVKKGRIARAKEVTGIGSSRAAGLVETLDNLVERGRATIEERDALFNGIAQAKNKVEAYKAAEQFIAQRSQPAPAPVAAPPQPQVLVANAPEAPTNQLLVGGQSDVGVSDVPRPSVGGGSAAGGAVTGGGVVAAGRVPAPTVGVPDTAGGVRAPDTAPVTAGVEQPGGAAPAVAPTPAKPTKPAKAAPIEKRIEAKVVAAAMEGKPVLSGGALDFGRLKNVVESEDPLMYRAVMYTLGRDTEGDRMPRALSSEEAAAKIGKPGSGATIRKIWKSLGLDDATRKRIAASEVTAREWAEEPARPAVPAPAPATTQQAGTQEEKPAGKLANNALYKKAVEQNFNNLSEKEWLELAKTLLRTVQEGGTEDAPALKKLNNVFTQRAKVPAVRKAIAAAYEQERAAQEANVERETLEEEYLDEADATERGEVRGADEDTQPSVDTRRTTKRDAFHTAESLEDSLLAFMRTDSLGRRVFIVDNVGELSKLVPQRAIDDMLRNELAGRRPVAFARDGKAYLIADRIRVGDERGIFLHEVGGHLGLERLLGTEKFVRLARQIGAWARKEDGSQESKLALRALERVAAADTKPEQTRAELVAYFLEEAVKAGIDPRATKSDSPLNRWLRELWAAFKVALRKLGVKIETITPQDIVDMAYGAARVNVTGKWHGTTAKIQRFRNKYMGTGEGAQAYGWGQYFSELRGVGEEYRDSDVRRKTKGGAVQMVDGTPITEPRVIRELMDMHRAGTLTLDNLKVYQSRMQELLKKYENNPAMAKEATKLEYDLTEIGDIIDAGGAVYEPPYRPDGRLYAADFAIADDEWLDWTKPFDKQSSNVRTALNSAKAKLAVPTKADFREALKDTRQLVPELYDDAKDRMTAKTVLDIIESNVNTPSAIKEDGFSAGVEALYNMRSKGIPTTPLADIIDDMLANVVTSMDVMASLRVERLFSNNAQGREIYLALADTIGSDKAASEYLDSIGIKGIRVPVNNSRGGTYEQGTNFVVFNDNNIIRVMNNPENSVSDEPQYSIAAPANMTTQPRGTVERNISKLPARLRPVARSVTGALRRYSDQGLNYMTFTTDLLDRAVKMGLVAAKKYKELHNQKAAFVGEHEQRTAALVARYQQLPDEVKGKNGLVNTLLYDSTREGKWAFQPDWLDTVEIDNDMAQRFNALPASAQSFVTDVFRFGNYTLELKKETVRNAVNSQYDALIKDAEERDEKALVTKYRKERDAALKQFGSIMRLSGKTPYAPLKRFGNIVVVAKSQAYIDAVNEGNDAEVKKLQRDEAHYYVDFVETAGQAETLVDKLRATGAYADGEEGVVYRKRELMRNELYGGSNTIQALEKLRANIDAMYGKGRDEVEESDNNRQRVAARKLNDMVTELYILTLAEDSARRSELKRKGVAGDIDMIRSLETQGRSDANFLGGARYNYAMLEQINEMRRESKRGTQQYAKSEIFNEIVARHIQGSEYSPMPIIDKLRRFTSIWMLTTSPAYYIQNATQPWLVSLPIIAGKHDFARSASALTKAYEDIAKPFAETRFGNFDFEKLLGDENKKLSDGEKKLLRDLLNKQQLDIGLATELGRFRIEGEGRVADATNRASDFIDGLMQKMEATNRIATALAAYRLDKERGASDQAAIDYASEIINDTHGDYSAWNAPRAFNTKLGSIALQFRKFQLIQLSLLAKSAKTALNGADPKERAVARKALAFLLTQAFVVGGARALPIPAFVGLAISAAFGDAGEPPEYLLRQALGDNALTDILIGGVPAAFGVNTQSVGLGNTFALLPFTDINLTERAGLAQTAYALFGGPLGGIGYRASDGIGYMMNGDYYKGLEQLLPRGVSSAMKAVRMETEGITQRDGDVTVSPDQFKLWQSALQAVGLTPEVEIRRMQNQRTAFTVQKNLDSEEQRIKKDYREAIRSRDTAAAAQARQDWADYNAKRRNLGFTPKPMSTLLKSPTEQAKRERTTAGGVPYTAQSEGFVRRLAGEQ